jgi:hypothetical protein
MVSLVSNPLNYYKWLSNQMAILYLNF